MMPKMAKGAGSFNVTRSLNAGIKMSTQFLLLNTVAQVANLVPNMPPLAKVLLGASAQIQTYRIARTALATQSGPLKTIGLALLGVYETLAAIQQIPNVIATIQSGFGGAVGSTGGQPYTPFLGTGVAIPQ